MVMSCCLSIASGRAGMAKCARSGGFDPASPLQAPARRLWRTVVSAAASVCARRPHRPCRLVAGRRRHLVRDRITRISAGPHRLRQTIFARRSRSIPVPATKQRHPAGWTAGVPMLVLIGAADVWTPLAPCQEFLDGAIARGSRARSRRVSRGLSRLRRTEQSAARAAGLQNAGRRGADHRNRPDRARRLLRSASRPSSTVI